MARDPREIAEENARAAARGRYFQWLIRRFGAIDLLSISDDPDPISLRKIFVPLRADKTDIDEERMAGPKDVSKESLPGRAVWDLLTEEKFVALSGRPGSGKTTLVHAIVLELCDVRRVSDFRKTLAGDVGIAPIPLILRRYLNELNNAKTLDDLLDAWWRDAESRPKQTDCPWTSPA